MSARSSAKSGSHSGMSGAASKGGSVNNSINLSNIGNSKATVSGSGNSGGSNGGGGNGGGGTGGAGGSAGGMSMGMSTPMMGAEKKPTMMQSELRMKRMALKRKIMMAQKNGNTMRAMKLREKLMDTRMMGGKKDCGPDNIRCGTMSGMRAMTQGPGDGKAPKAMRPMRSGMRTSMAPRVRPPMMRGASNQMRNMRVRNRRMAAMMMRGKRR